MKTLSIVQPFLPQYKKLLLYWLYTFFFWTLVEAYFTSVTFIILSFRGIPVSWSHLSLNYFSKGWMWVLFMPLIYWIHQWILNRKWSRLKRLGIVLFFAVPVGIIHILSSYYFDLLMRRYLNIIDLDFWISIQENIPLIIKGCSTSFLTFILIIGFLTSWELFNFSTEGSKKTFYKNGHTNGIWNAFFQGIIIKNRNGKVYRERLALKSNGKIVIVKIEEIQYLQSEGNYVKIHLSSNWILVRETMKNLETTLNPDFFYRINRSAIINIDFVQELEPWFNGEYIITLQNTTQFRTSKTYRKNLLRLLGDKK